jgi:hypothetical protein
MTSAGISGIDHLVVLVDDLAGAAQRAAGAGFTVTPRSAHSKLGSANHCLMFADGDYVELMGFVAEAPHLADLRAHLAEHGPGPAALALRTDDAAEDFERLAAAGLEPETPLDFGRPVTLPTGETVEVAFRIVRLPATGTVGPPLFLCEHRSRDQVWHPGWLHHANGARGLAALRGVAPTAAALRALAVFYGRVFGDETVTVGKSTLTVRPRHGARVEWRREATAARVGLAAVEWVGAGRRPGALFQALMASETPPDA